jgi:DNA-binding NarL/FixJ family response regulator
MLVDDYAPLVRTWTRIASRFPDLELVALTDPLDAEFTLRKAAFDALCVDEMMPGLRGTDLAGRVRPLHPAMGIVLFSAAVDMDIARRALDVGVDCFLPKPFEPGELIEAATRAHERRRYTDVLTRIADVLKGAKALPQPPRLVHPFEQGLTLAERAVFELCLSGASLKEMAAARSVGINTIKKQVQAVYGKAGVHSRRELMDRWRPGTWIGGV